MLVVALVVAGFVVAGFVVVGQRDGGSPMAVVLAHVEAVARGDGAAANALLAPGVRAVDPALLAGASERITVVGADQPAGAGTETAEVEVRYALGGTESTAVVAVRRTGTTLGLLDEWRVTGPLLVPVLVGSNDPNLTTARFGSATVPVGGPGIGDYPLRRFFAYPGGYPLRGHESRYLAAPEQSVRVSHRDAGDLPRGAGRAVTADLVYAATPALTAALTDRIADHLTACVAGLPELPPGCPHELYRVADPASLRVVRPPVTATVVHERVRFDPDGSRPPNLRFTATGGLLAHAGGSTPFGTSGRVVVDQDDGLTVAFATLP